MPLRVSLRVLVAVFCLVLVATPAVVIAMFGAADTAAAESVVAPLYREVAATLQRTFTAQVSAMAADAVLLAQLTPPASLSATGCGCRYYDAAAPVDADANRTCPRPSSTADLAAALASLRSPGRAARFALLAAIDAEHTAGGRAVKWQTCRGSTADGDPALARPPAAPVNSSGTSESSSSDSPGPTVTPAWLSGVLPGPLDGRPPSAAPQLAGVLWSPPATIDGGASVTGTVRDGSGTPDPVLAQGGDLTVVGWQWHPFLKAAPSAGPTGAVSAVSGRLNVVAWAAAAASAISATLELHRDEHHLAVLAWRDGLESTSASGPRAVAPLPFPKKFFRPSAAASMAPFVLAAGTIERGLLRDVVGGLPALGAGAAFAGPPAEDPRLCADAERYLRAVPAAMAAPCSVRGAATSRSSQRGGGVLGQRFACRLVTVGLQVHCSADVLARVGTVPPLPSAGTTPAPSAASSMSSTSASATSPPMVGTTPGRVVFQRYTVVLSGPDPQRAADIFSGAKAAAVVVGVSVTGAALLLVLTALHYTFHPLKVLTGVLRACADVDFADMERMDASRIADIFRIQFHAQQLVRRLLAYAPYMPDRAQLLQALGIYDDNDDPATPAAGVAAASAAVKAGAVAAQGGVVHTATVVAEYRSRRAPDAARDATDRRKRCAFTLVYGADGDDVLQRLLAQCRERFQERVGEPLEARLVPKGATAESAPAAATVPLTSSDELLRAVEADGAVLHVLVMKASERRVSPWVLLAATFVTVLVVAGQAAVWLKDDRPFVSRTGAVVTACLGASVALNLLNGLYLVRRFVVASPEFALWLPAAPQEALVAVLLGGVSLSALAVLFSHTRVTRRLRFNAPHVPGCEQRIVQHAAPGYAVGNVCPLVGAAYLAVSLGTEAWSVLFALSVGCAVLNTLGFLFQRHVAVVVAAVVGSARRREVSTEAWRDVRSALSQPLLRPAEVFAADDGDGALRPFEASTPSRQELVSLELQARDATVLRLALHDGGLRLQRLPLSDAQRVCQRFLSAVFAEARHFGGVVLSSGAAEATVAFNCHRPLQRHLPAAVRCFFAVKAAVAATVEWRADGSDTWRPPQCTGAVVSGPGTVVGYAGRGAGRTLQHCGASAAVLQALASVGQHYHAALVVMDQTLASLEAAGRAASVAEPAGPRPGNASFPDDRSFARLSVTLASNPFSRDDLTSPVPEEEHAVLIPTVPRVGARRRAAEPRPPDVLRSLVARDIDTVALPSGRHAVVFELRYGASEELALSSRAATAVPVGVDGSAPSAAAQAPHRSAALGRHLRQYPHDTVARRMRRTHAMARGPRGVFPGAVELLPADTGAHAHAHGPGAVQAAAEELSPEIAAALRLDNVTIHFTDL